MFDKPQASHTLGLDIDGSSLKGAVLSFLRGTPKLEEIFEFPVEFSSDSEGHVKPLYTDQQKQQLQTQVHKNLVVTALPAQEILVRPLDLKIKKERDIDSILPFQSEPLLPYSIEKALVDKILLSKDKNGCKLTITALRKDHLAEHMKQWNSLQVDPEVVSASPAALAAFIKQFIRDKEMIYAVHIGNVNSMCILVHQQKLIAAQAIPHGLDVFVRAYAQDQEVDFASARQQLLKVHLTPQLINENPRLKKSLETWKLDLARTIYSITKQTKGADIQTILCTGEGAIYQGLAEYLCELLKKTPLEVTSLPNFSIASTELRRFALPIGAALSALPKTQDQINFRQQEFAYPAPWKRLKQPIALYLSLCLATAIALILFGKAYLSYQEGALKQEYLSLLNVMNRPYADFEKSISNKIPSSRQLPAGEIIPIEALTPEEMKDRLNFLEKEILSMPQFYPLQPNVPRVSDVLAWISAHPKVTGKLAGDEKGEGGLKIENFNYVMTKRPELAKKQERYQVKVELEFSSPTPKMAREFHDALIAPNEIVDPKGEIKWNSIRDKYRTSFYLQDKTIYPNN